ncbi:MAG: hypothetical protein E6G27_03685 [Actinobacteria bacterium]|nr:MAG: hypothetical protein E6G27_03685 [Actinomycetota bacterium]
MAIQRPPPGPDVPERCPMCRAPIDGAWMWESGDFERVGCRACGLQLVRGPGGQWGEIRG